MRTPPTSMAGELRLRVRAGCPAVWIASSEEARVVGALERMAASLGRTLWVYTATRGMTQVEREHGGDPLWPSVRRSTPQSEFRDPIAALGHLVQAAPQSSIFLFVDFDPFCGDPLVQRHLKDGVERLRDSLNTVVFLSERRPPAGVAPHVWVLEWPLPDRGDLRRSLGCIEAALDGRKVPVCLSDDDRRRLVETALGLTVNQFEDALAVAVVRAGRLDEGARGQILAEKITAFQGAAGLDMVAAPPSLEDLGGLADFKAWLRSRAAAFSEAAAAAGVAPPKGVLLLGVQGCGKSLAAKTCGPVLGFPVVRLDAGALFTAEIGGSEARTREALRRVDAMAPCVLWVDELEKATAGMAGSGRSDAGTAARVFACLAIWLQERTRRVFVAATANGVSELPPEMLRKGRWDEIFFVDLPTPGEREELFAVHLKRSGCDPSVFNTALLADATPGFSGAEIEGVVAEARLEAFCRKRPMAVEDLLEAVRRLVPLSRTMKEPIEALRQWARGRARRASPETFDADITPGRLRAL